jgi:hypothetical protein
MSFIQHRNMEKLERLGLVLYVHVDMLVTHSLKFSAC